MYQPVLNRFMSRDPLPPDGQPDIPYDNNWFGDRRTWMRNTYGYASNNPVNRVDPSGLQDFIAPIFCPPLALRPIFQPPVSVHKCSHKNFIVKCGQFYDAPDERGNCDPGYTYIDDNLIVGGLPRQLTYCMKCTDLGGLCGARSRPKRLTHCIPCVEELTAPTIHPYPGKPGDKPILMDKGSKLHRCRCFQDDK